MNFAYDPSNCRSQPKREMDRLDNVKEMMRVDSRIRFIVKVSVRDQGAVYVVTKDSNCLKHFN